MPVHVISYNCTEPSTIDFLKHLARMTGGRFHAYAVVMEMDSYERDVGAPRTNQANIILRKKTYGGVPPGAGMREDVMLLFEELEEARNNLIQIQALIDDYPTQQVKVSPGKSSGQCQSGEVIGSMLPRVGHRVKVSPDRSSDLCQSW